MKDFKKMLLVSLTLVAGPLYAQGGTSAPVGGVNKQPMNDPVTGRTVPQNPNNATNNTEVTRRPSSTNTDGTVGTVGKPSRDCPAGFTRNTKATSAEECVPISEGAAGTGEVPNSKDSPSRPVPVR